MMLGCGCLLFSTVIPCVSLPTSTNEAQPDGQTMLSLSLKAHTSSKRYLRRGMQQPHNPNITPRDYEKAYNDLYNNYGYHANSDFTHETGAIHQMVAYRNRLPPTASALHKVLVLGCSHGKGAELLHKHGFNAYGIDVAHRAIERANDRSRTCESGTEPCFVQGSLMKLPYSNSSFDGGLSVDVLEHIAPGDVPQVVKEISRVVRHYLFLQIASFKEMALNGEKAGMANVHLTVEGPQWWKTAFAQGGWKVTRDTSDASYVQLVLEK